MGATTDKIKGATNEAIGKAKQGIGEATGSDRLQGEGVIQELKGKGQKAVGDAKDADQGCRKQGSRGGKQESLIEATRLVRSERPVPSGPAFLCASCLLPPAGRYRIARSAMRLPLPRSAATSPPAIRRRTSASRSAE